MKNKKIFTYSLLLLIFLCSLQGYSQYTNPANYVLPSLIGTQTQYTARDYIKLTPGFTFTATGSTTATTLNAKIDELSIPLVNPNPTSPILANDPALEIDTLLPVAAIPGKAGVSGSGAATYEIPIGMPPGSKGMVPNLSIVYNSQAGNGIMGLGWNISGLSAITRIPQTFYKNGNTTAVDFSANDRFALDGNRLVQTVGTVYGANNAEYHTESENFSKIISYGTAGTGPSYFTVTTTDGTVIEYGNTNDSRFIPSISTGPNQTAFSWHINKITDKFGNYMLFKYRTVNNELIIDQIEYTGNANANLSPYNKVKFYYEEKTDKSFYYVGGVKLQQNLLLSKIKVYAETQIRDEYTFDYFYDNTLAATKLKKVNQKVNGQTDINSTKVLWNEYSNLLFSLSTNLNFNALSICTPNGILNNTGCSHKYYTGDFNGDGRSDLIVVEGFNSYSNLFGNIQFFATAIKLLIADNSINGFHFSCSLNSIFQIIQGDQFRDLSSVDIDNDGIDEIFIKYYESNNAIFRLYKYNSNTNEINDSYQTSFLNFPTTLVEENCWPKHRRQIKKDFNGDGQVDIITLSKVTQTPGENSKFHIEQLLIRASSSNFIFSDITNDINNYISSLNLSYYRRIEIMDFNGNGKTDIMVSTANGSIIFEYEPLLPMKFKILYNSSFPIYNETDAGINTISNKFYLGDFNGDKKTDILYYPLTPLNQQYWYLSYSNGIDFEQPVQISGVNKDYYWNNYSTYWNFEIFDIDNNGYDDIIERNNLNTGSASQDIFIYLNKKTTFEKKDIGTITGILSNHDKENQIILADFNGDGKFEFLSQSTLIQNVNIYNYINNSTPQFVKSIVDGFNNKNTFENKSLASGIPFYIKYNNSVFPIKDIQAPIYCVSKLTLTKSSDVNNPICEEYIYKGLRYHCINKSSLGFTEIEKINFQEGVKTITTYENIGNFFYRVNKKIELFANSTNDPLNINWQKINEISYENDNNIFPSVNSVFDIQRFFYYVKKTVNKNFISNILKSNEFINGPIFGANGSDEGIIITKEKTYNSINSTTAFEEITNEITKVKPAYCNWFPSKATYEKTTRVSDAIPYIRTKKYDYYTDDKKLEYITTDDQNLDFNVKLKFELYNSFGIPEKIKTHPSVNNPYNLSIVEQTNTFDSKGRFLIEDKNTFNQITTYSYEPKFGNILKVSDINGLETRFEYDAIGRKKKTINADNTEESVAYNWANGSSYPANSLYKITASSTGDPDVVSYYDALGRAFRIETTNFNNELIRTTTAYDEKGRVYQTSLPYLASTSLIKNTTYTYDYLGRLTHQTNPDASFTNIIYSATTPRLTTVQTGGTNITTQNKETKSNCLGQAEYVKDNNNKKVNYLYNSAGQLIESWVDGMSNHITMTYNLQGNRLSINDPDAGLTTSVYDAYGQLRVQKDGKQNTVNNPLYGTSTTYNYDALGRVTTVIQPEFTNTYTYGSATPNINKLLSVVSVNTTTGSTTSNTYQYDALGRSVQTTEAINDNGVSKSFTLSNDYDSYGRVNTITYPDNNLKIKYDYQNGQLKAVKRLIGTAESNIWQANTQDLLGNYNNYTTGFNTGAWTKAKTYNQDNGRLISIKTGPSSNRIQDLTYTYDNIGNLTSRTENMYNSILSYQKEDFNYDNLNRLNGITYSNNVSTSPLKTINYDNGGLGNITTMPDVGNFTYDTQKLHAITQITNNPGNINTKQQVDYTSFNKVLKLEDGQSGTAAFKKLMFKYGPDYSRRKTSYYEGTSAVSVDKYFALGCYEEEVNNTTGIAVKDFYINAGDGLAAIYRITGTNPGVMYYIHKDNMGSFDKVTNESGAVVDRYSFDAWGNRRNYDNWTLPDNSTHLFSRGYTGHEHLDKFGLINMNGRLYDSKLGRFLSPDPVLQDPSNTQNYNRYSYCLNNPFRYYDPSGYEYDDYDDSYWGDEDEIPPGGRDFGKVFGPIEGPRTENMDMLRSIVCLQIDVIEEHHLIEKLPINDYYDSAIRQNGGYSDTDDYDNSDEDYDIENNYDRSNDLREEIGDNPYIQFYFEFKLDIGPQIGFAIESGIPLLAAYVQGSSMERNIKPYIKYSKNDGWSIDIEIDKNNIDYKKGYSVPFYSYEESSTFGFEEHPCFAKTIIEEQKGFEKTISIDGIEKTFFNAEIGTDLNAAIFGIQLNLGMEGPLK